ncbi:hypothetical protein, partial [Staphylococcus shinii]|uniref:hypothetical protein n=1 Tax=Staphylococcus shinii TaxID=2912228 RepID=UPI003F549973
IMVWSLIIIEIFVLFLYSNIKITIDDFTHQPLKVYSLIFQNSYDLSDQKLLLLSIDIFNIINATTV